MEHSQSTETIKSHTITCIIQLKVFIFALVFSSLSARFKKKKKTEKNGDMPSRMNGGGNHDSCM